MRVTVSINDALAYARVIRTEILCNLNIMDDTAVLYSRRDEFTLFRQHNKSLLNANDPIFFSELPGDLSCNTARIQTTGILRADIA